MTGSSGVLLVVALLQGANAGADPVDTVLDQYLSPLDAALAAQARSELAEICGEAHVDGSLRAEMAERLGAALAAGHRMADSMERLYDRSVRRLAQTNGAPVARDDLTLPDDVARAWRLDIVRASFKEWTYSLETRLRYPGPVDRPTKELILQQVDRLLRDARPRIREFVEGDAADVAADAVTAYLRDQAVANIEADDPWGRFFPRAFTEFELQQVPHWMEMTIQAYRATLPDQPGASSPIRIDDPEIAWFFRRLDSSNLDEPMPSGAYELQEVATALRAIYLDIGQQILMSQQRLLAPESYEAFQTLRMFDRARVRAFVASRALEWTVSTAQGGRGHATDVTPSDGQMPVPLPSTSRRTTPISEQGGASNAVWISSAVVVFVVVAGFMLVLMRYIKTRTGARND